MNREKALILIKKHVKNENSIKHMLAAEAIMRDLAARFGEDMEKWGLTGLVHDIDMEIVDCAANPEEHGKEGADILKREGICPEIAEAVKAHNPKTGKRATALLERAIYSADPLTGLIVASVLVIPSRKLSDLTSSSVLKRYREKSFARGVVRETIKSCSQMGLELEEFVEIGLNAMKKIAKELGL